MKYAIMLMIVVALAAVAAPATAGQRTLAFFADENRASCEITNTTPELITMHMFLAGKGETANTVSFYAPTPSCWTGATWLGDEITDEYLFLGTSHDEEYGITITFTGCRDLPVRLGSMAFWASGSERCCTYAAYPVPFARTGHIEVVNCDITTEAIPYTSVVINPDESCTCSSSSLVATEETSWGRIKSLYR